MISRVLCTLAVLHVVACSDSNGPRQGLNIISGDNQVDTVNSYLSIPLIIQVLNSDRQPNAQHPVRFGSPGAVLISPTWDPSYLTNGITEMTDANGEAAVLIRFKQYAGRDDVNVVDQTSNQEIRAYYTILPGVRAGVRAEPRDTTLSVGGRMRLRSIITDAYGNRRADTDTATFTYTSLNGALSVSAPDQATATAVGRGVVTVSALGFRDTVRASVVPTGRIAAQAFSATAIVAMNLDGSSVDSITSPVRGSMDWSSVNHTFVMDVDGPEYLLEMDTLGHTHRVVTNALMRSEFYPRYSSNGSYIYFTGNDSLSTCYGVWRIHPDGAALEQVVADTLHCGPQSYIFGPSPSYATSLSPDGVHLAYAARTLRVRTLATGADTSLGVVGDVPRWSPTGTWIAYDSLGTLMLIHPDGTGHQALVDRGDVWYPSNLFAWSPDGQWLLYHTSDRLVLVQVATGLQLPLAVTIGLMDPTWLR